MWGVNESTLINTKLMIRLKGARLDWWLKGILKSIEYLETFTDGEDEHNQDTISTCC